MSGGKDVEETEERSAVFLEQLQAEYNKLLTRYAEAENTIDALRTGARIHLYTDSQDLKPVTCSNSETMRRSQRINFPRPSQAVVSSPTTEHFTGIKSAGHHNISSSDSKHLPRKHVNGESSLTENPRDIIEGRVQVLKENVESLENCLAENEMTRENLNEVSSISQQLQEDHKKLHEEFKKFSRPSTPSANEVKAGLSTCKNELEKQLYRIGLRLQDIQQNVAGKIRLNNESCFDPNGQVENNQRDLDESTSQRVSSLDPDLAKLITKLKDLRDRSIENKYANPDSSKSDQRNLPDDRYEKQQQKKDSRPPISHDDIDSRYLTPSPVHLEYDSETPSQTNDYFTYDVKTTTYHSPDRLNNHDAHSIKNNNSSGSARDLAGPSTYIDQPITTYDLRSYSNEEISSERSQSPISVPGNQSRFYGISSTQAPDKSSYKDVSNERNVDKLLPEEQLHKVNSMSDLAASSRRSTPLFHPRSSTRVPGEGTRMMPHNQRRRKYKPEETSNGFDSGFVGSEESRSSRMTESPNNFQKLNLSNQWDSSLRLDLSEINENDSVSSDERSSRSYEDATKHVRRSASPVVVRTSPRDTIESNFLNSSPSPLSSPDRLENAAQHFGHNTSRSPSNRSSHRSTPVPRMQHSNPTLQRTGERQSSERSLHGEPERTLGANRGYGGIGGGHSRTDAREVSLDDSFGEKPRRLRESAERKINESQNRETLADLQNNITGLRTELESVLDQSRVSLDIHNDSRREDEDFRNSLRRENDRKFHELRVSIERLRNEFCSRNKPDRHRRQPTTHSDDDLQNEVNNISQKLHELSKLRTSSRRSSRMSSGTPSVSVGNHTVDHFSSLTERVNNLRLHVDELKTRIESEAEQDVDKIRCRLCDDVTKNHHSYQPSKSHISPHLLSHVYESPRVSTKKSSMPQNLSLSYPGVYSQSPVIHHVHTYHQAPVKDENDSSPEENLRPKRTRRSNRRSRRREYQHSNSYEEFSPALDEARHAARDVQRLSKSILNKISLDLTSFKS